MDVESNTPDAEESAMRELGQQADSNEGRPTEQPAAETPQTAPEPPESPQPEAEPEVQQPPESPETEPIAAEQRPRDPVTGKFQKPATAGKPETDYTRAQKEQERKDRSWQALQAEKEQFRQYASQWEEQQRMAQLESTRQQYQPLKKDGLTAQEYYEGAQRFEQEGDHENALKAYKVASEMGRTEQQRYAQMQEMEAEYQWRLGMQEVGKVFPDIWNPNHPIVPHLERIISENPWIYRVPQGFQRAAEVAHMLTQMDSIKQLQDENESLRAQLEKYNHKGQPAKGGYAAPRTSDKEFDDMNLDEMKAHLEHVTAEADSWR
jgi:hypothetical protein